MVPSFVWSTHPVCVPIVSLKRCVLCYSWALLRRPVFRLGLGTGNSLRRSVSLWPRDTIESFPLQGPAVSLQRGTGLQPLLGYHSMSLMSFQFFVVVQSLSHVRFFVTPWTTAHQASLSFTISHSLLKLMSIELVMPSNHLLCHSLLLLRSGSFSVSRFFASRGQSTGPSSFGISPSNKYSGLISFRTDWFDLFAFQETLKSLLQHHSSKASILQN